MLFWYSCFKFFKYSCKDISIILITISRIDILQSSEQTYSLQLYQKKNPFISILQGFSKLFRNTYFTEHHFVAASKRGLSGIFWNLGRSLWLENQLLFYQIKHKTTYPLFYFWKYEDINKVNRKHDMPPRCTCWKEGPKSKAPWDILLKGNG